MKFEELADIDKLRALREEVKRAFHISTGEELLYSRDLDNKYYEDLGDAIRKELNLAPKSPVPQAGTLIKFFYFDGPVSFAPRTIRLLTGFSKVCTARELALAVENGRSQENNYDLKGVEIINEGFKVRVESYSGFTPVDFYTAKDENDCQWHGIAKGWTANRIQYAEAAKKVAAAFDSKCEVSCIVYGRGGTGKSTFLRKMAWEFANVFTVLWVYDLDVFTRKSLDQISFRANKYLIFVEDWHSFESNTPLISSFLNKIRSQEKVRVIIGDRETTDKEYLDYVSDRNIFELSSLENKDILHHVSVIEDKWRNTINKISSTSINHATLYLILFVIARVHSGKGKFKLLHIDCVRHFNSIVRSDIKRASVLYKGLAIALYYWSNFYLSVSHREKSNLRITWEAFLKLADFYNGDKTISSRLSNKGNTEYNLLLSYIEIVAFVDPRVTGLHWFRFHHDLLAEALSKVRLKGWAPFDNSIKLEILEVLVKEKEAASAGQVFALLSLRFDSEYTGSVFDGNDSRASACWTSIQKFNEDGLPSFLVFRGNDELVELYANAKLRRDNMYWLSALPSAVYYAPKIVLETLIDKGCTVPIVLEAYKLATQKNLKNHAVVDFITKRYVEEHQKETLDKI